MLRPSRYGKGLSPLFMQWINLLLLLRQTSGNYSTVSNVAVLQVVSDGGAVVSEDRSFVWVRNIEMRRHRTSLPNAVLPS
jgi:hypothetical protein